MSKKEKVLAECSEDILLLQLDRIKELQKHWLAYQQLHMHVGVDLFSALDRFTLDRSVLVQSLNISICILYRSLFQTRVIAGEFVKILSFSAFSPSFWKDWEEVHNIMISYADGSFAHQDPEKKSVTPSMVRGKKVYQPLRFIDKCGLVGNTYPNLMKHNLDAAITDMIHTIVPHCSDITRVQWALGIPPSRV